MLSQTRKSPRDKSGSHHGRRIHLLRARISRQQRDEMIRQYLELLDTPMALGAWLRYKTGEHLQLVQMSVDPLSYDNAELFRRDYAAVKFLSKCSGLKTGIDLRGVAIDKAVEAEALCASTNERIRTLRKFPRVNAALQAKWFVAQQTIAKILGPVPESFRDVGWSAGRTTSAFGDCLSGVHKYPSQPDVTLAARHAALKLLREAPSWSAAILDADGPCEILMRGLTVVQGNTMLTVPKNAKTDRVICYEPHMNIRLQLAVGAYMKSRLMKHGINLYDQSVNRNRALSGSLTGRYATIDLSMASDTIARELVYELLPVDWAVLLNDYRSRYTTWPDGSTRYTEKFSSMGNGFTFELESLIFYALASAESDDVSVYGDDLICPTTSFDAVKAVLQESGFRVNQSKSFSAGWFKESCGMDAFRGVDCTPVYLRSLPTTVQDVVKLHNQVRDYCARELFPDRKWHAYLVWLRQPHTVPLGPSGYGDGHFHACHDETRPTRATDVVKHLQWEGWCYSTFVPVYRTNDLYGDRILGNFSGRFGHGAICAAIGPRSVRSVFGVSSNRRLVKYKKHRGVVTVWPSINWM